MIKYLVRLFNSKHKVVLEYALDRPINASSVKYVKLLMIEFDAVTADFHKVKETVDHYLVDSASVKTINLK